MKKTNKSERAWVDKHAKDRVPMSCSRWPNTKKKTYLEFVRYMRWYCYDARSYLMRKINPMPPFYQDPFYKNYPKHTP